MTNQLKIATNQLFACDICDYVYDPASGCPEQGVDPNSPWEAVPDDWVCPECGAPKKLFSPVD